MIGMSPTVLQHNNGRVRSEPRREISSRQGGNDSKRKRYRAGMPQQNVQLRRGIHGVIVTPPECGGCAGVMPTIEFVPQVQPSGHVATFVTDFASSIEWGVI
jgi:hypothetical protein